MPQEADKTHSTESKEVATIGGGCFWCIEAIFADLKGVERVESGYSGSSIPNPTYDQVCTGTTGHAEVVQITFNPSVISFKEILEIFFTIHDPTTLNRQGADEGPQYRSIILYHNDDQKRIAEQVTREIEAARIWDKPIVTQVEPFQTFYRAEKYHQEYFKYHPEQPYCQVIIAPKVAKFRQRYHEKLKK
ncbi:peptide-methionine (S)-S-oxide reductase MsrA [[Eubacterium] cellulosolvens]